MGTAQSGFLIDIYEPPKAALQHAQLIYSLVFLLLVADVFFDLLLIFTNCGYEVSSRPELLAGEVSFLSGIGSGYVNCTFAFHIAYHLGNTILGRYADYHMHMIRLQTAGLDTRFLVPSQFCQYLAQFLPDLTE